MILGMLLEGCQYDPHGGLYLTTEPKDQDIVGTYVLDRFDLPTGIKVTESNVEVELHADGTFIAKNVPPWRTDDLSSTLSSSLVSGTGKWEKASLGTLDPGGHSMWGIYLRTPDNRFCPANFTGRKLPYGLIFVLGDPDSGDAILLKRKS